MKTFLLLLTLFALSGCAKTPPYVGSWQTGNGMSRMTLGRDGEAICLGTSTTYHIDGDAILFDDPTRPGEVSRRRFSVSEDGERLTLEMPGHNGTEVWSRDRGETPASTPRFGPQ